MKKAVIIEDESIIANNLRKLIVQADKGWEVIQILPSVQTAIEWLEQHPSPDLIFSDIQLSDGISFEIFERYKTTVPVIFVTAYDEYALKAFKVNSIFYLLKPVSAEDVVAALDKYDWMFNGGMQQGTAIEQLLHDIQHKTVPAYKKRFLAHYMQSIIPVNESQITYFKKDQIIYLVTKDGNEMTTDYNTLDELEELLDPLFFFRANRQHIIHIDGVKQFKAHYNGKIQVTTPSGYEIEISREKAMSFKEWINR